MTGAEAVHAYIERLYKEDGVTGADGQVYQISPIALTRDKGAFLGNVCRSEGARTALEIGMAWGLSSLFILEALIYNGAGPRAHVIIDPLQSSKFHRAGLGSIKALGLEELIDFHEEFSEFALPTMVKEGRAFDFVFVDGNHRFDGVMLDAIYADRLLKPGGTIVFDDTWSADVFLSCRYLETNRDYEAIGVYPPPRPNRHKRQLYRGQIRAYRKPLQSRPQTTPSLKPFYENIGSLSDNLFGRQVSPGASWRGLFKRKASV